MPYTNDKRFYGIFVALLPFFLAFALAYCNSVRSTVKPYQVFKDKYYQQNPLHQARIQPAAQIPKGRVRLQKNQKTCINRTCILFKGVSKGIIYLDVFLLELDPETPYPMQFTKASLRRGIRIGDADFTLAAVKRDLLYLNVPAADQP